MVYHAALDVSLRSVSICIIDGDGVIRFEDKVASDVEEIASCLRRFSSDVQSIGFEAGTLTFNDLKRVLYLGSDRGQLAIPFVL